MEQAEPFTSQHCSKGSVSLLGSKIEYFFAFLEKNQSISHSKDFGPLAANHGPSSLSRDALYWGVPPISLSFECNRVVNKVQELIVRSWWRWNISTADFKMVDWSMITSPWRKPFILHFIHVVGSWYVLAYEVLQVSSTKLRCIFTWPINDCMKARPTLWNHLE